MRPNKVVEYLNASGIPITRRTLYNYEQAGLIPEAKHSNSRHATYSKDAFYQAYTAHKLLNGFKLGQWDLKLPIDLARAIRDYFLAIRNFVERDKDLDNENTLSFDQFCDEEAKKIVVGAPGYSLEDAIKQFQWYERVYELIWEEAWEALWKAENEEKEKKAPTE